MIVVQYTCVTSNHDRSDIARSMVLTEHSLASYNKHMHSYCFALGTMQGDDIAPKSQLFMHMN
jgi:hypothetical protein